MPGVISVSDFVREVRDDYNSPTTSNFVNRIPQCKETVSKLEEVGLHLFLICRSFDSQIVLIQGFSAPILWSTSGKTNTKTKSPGNPQRAVVDCVKKIVKRVQFQRIFLLVIQNI